MRRPRSIKYDWQRMIREELREERERKKVKSGEQKSNHKSYRRFA